MYKNGISSLYFRIKSSWYGFCRSRLQTMATLLLFVLQQLVLYYSILSIGFNRIILYNLVLDVLLGIYILYGALSEIKTCYSRCAVQWFFYSMTVATKLAIAAFERGTHRDSLANSGLNHETSDNFLSLWVLYVTPMIYSIFNELSRRSLFSGYEVNVSVDEFLYSDLGLAMMLDIWDVILMYNHLTDWYRASLGSDSLECQILSRNLSVALIVMNLVTIFLLGLSFPAVDASREEFFIRDESGSKTFFDSSVLSSCFKEFWNNLKSYIPANLRGQKLRRSIPSIGGDFNWWEQQKDDLEVIEANKEFKFANERTISSESLPENQKKMLPSNVQSLNMFTMAKYTFLVGFFLIDLPFCIYRLYSLVNYGILSLMLYKNLLFLFLRPYRLGLNQLAERDSAKGWQTAFFEADSIASNILMNSNQSFIHEDFKMMDESKVDSENELTRRLADIFLKRGQDANRESSHGPRVTSKSILGRISTMVTSVDGSFLNLRRSKTKRASSPELAMFGDNNDATASNDVGGNRFSRRAPSFLNVARVNDIDESKKHILLTYLRKSRNFPVEGFPLYSTIRGFWPLLSDIWGISGQGLMNVESRVGETSSLCFYVISFLAIICSRIFIAMTNLALPNSVKPPILVFLKEPTNLKLKELANCFVLVISPIVLCISFMITGGVPILDVIFVSVKEFLDLLSFSFCTISIKTAVTSKNMLTYTLQMVMFLFWPTMILFNLLCRSVSVSGESLNSHLVYMLCRFGVAPTHLNRKFCSIDLVNSVQIIDALFHAQWSDFMCSALFRFLCCSISSSKLSLSCLALDLLIRCLYTTICQTLRILTLRMYEIHYIVLRIAGDVRFSWDDARDDFRDFKGQEDELMTLADVDEYIIRQGLFSSPGIIFPTFL